MDKTHHSVLLDECRLPYKDPLPFGNPLADILHHYHHHHLRRTLPCLAALLPLPRREEEGKRYDDVGDFDLPNLDLREEVDHNHAVEGEEVVHRSLEGEGEDLDPVGSEDRCWEGEGRSLADEEGEVHSCCRVVEGEEDHLCLLLLLHLLHKSRDRILTSLGRRS